MTVDYKTLSIDNKINAKTGWDIAVAYEGKQTFGYKCYTRLAELVRYGVNANLIGNIYPCYR